MLVHFHAIHTINTITDDDIRIDDRQVSELEARELAEAYGAEYREVKEDVEGLFEEVCEKVREKEIVEEKVKAIVLGQTEKRKKKADACKC